VSQKNARQHYFLHEANKNTRNPRLQGRTVREALGEARYAHLLPYIERVLGGETVTFEEQQDGAVDRTIEVTYIPQLDEHGVGVVGFHLMRQDISSQKREK
jgi:hypothetical protein